MFLVRAMFTLLTLLAMHPATADETLSVNRERAENLFSFPSNCHAVCYLDQTLSETIEHYLQDSLERDGITSSRITVTETSEITKITVSGAPEGYSTAIESFLAAGDKGLEGARRLHAEHKWRYNWRFYLPLGLPLVNNKSVEILHFPPDYVLEDVQDYLAANTTKRWASLLSENDVIPENTDAFQAIIDIAPISAPASDGQRLEGTYSYFSEYIKTLIEFWAIDHKTGEAKPTVAFGSPVRNYLRDQFGMDLSLLEYGELHINSDVTIPVIAANHPSRFYNAVNSFLEDNPNDKLNAVLLGIAITQSDLVAACWQATMADQHNAKAPDVLVMCHSKWQNSEKRICEIVVEQRFAEDVEAKTICDEYDLIKHRNISAIIHQYETYDD